MTKFLRQNKENSGAADAPRSPQRVQPHADNLPQPLAEPPQRDTFYAGDKQYRAIFTQSLDGILFTGPDGRIFAANPAACRMLQRTEEEICRLGRDALVDTHSAGSAGAERKQTGGFRGELTLLCADGNSFPADVSSTQFIDDSGQERVVVFFRDVSDRKQAEKAFRETQTLFHSFMNNSQAAAYIKDETGHYVYVNALAAQRIFGRKHSEVLGQTDSDLWPPEIARKVREADMTVCETALPLKVEESGELADGIHHWLSLKFPLSVAPGRQMIGGISVDITERKQAQEEIERLNGALEQHVSELSDLNQELESFSYSVSHDLRAPLRHIQGFVELLHKHTAVTLDDKGRRYLAIITKSAKQMGMLIDDLLAFSRTTRTEVHATRVNLTDLVNESMRDLAEDTATRQIVWDVEPLPEVWGDAALLRIVMNNLLNNAAKYTRPRSTPQITIGCTSVVGPEWVCFVRDNGVGFDMQYVDKLFGVFQRLHRDDEFEGTGIGLATVQRIVHRLGGRVWAEGEIDRGATFYFSLPTAQKRIEG